MVKEKILSKLKGGLIVSCQAEDPEPLASPQILAAMSRAAVSGGAVGIRANLPQNISAIHKAVDVPVIGIFKKIYPNSDVMITPTLKDALEIVRTGAEILALDATNRPRPKGESLENIVSALRKQEEILLMADISNLEEGLIAAELGFDIIASTLSGYTEYTREGATDGKPDFELISQLNKQWQGKIPVIAEGRIGTPEEAVEAFRCGAFALVVGTAITRPAAITRQFSEAIAAYSLRG